MEPNSVCHVDWHALDFDRVKKFYGELFGWTFQDWDPEYLMFNAPGNVSGGFVKTDKFDPAQGAVVYILVTDLEVSRQKVIELGGTASLAHEIPGHGQISLLTDTEGNNLGIFQSNGA